MNKVLGLCVLTCMISAAYADSVSSLRYSKINEAISFDSLIKDPTENRQQSIREDLVTEARKLIGVPYLYGGTTRKGFDCSGLVQFVFKGQGLDLPRISADQFRAFDPVAEPKLGDLLFFGRPGRVQHVGIFVGEGKMLHAPSSGKHVTIDTYTDGYWGNRYLGASSPIEANVRDPRQLAQIVQIEASADTIQK
ncbi:C40 family peptidase [Suttonella sp. R2A3]|uniref:C40 family peptidase n=1 Tax=Suttonella sp. R2A3 TaxID=2908648 RepID=UPI001F227903|nr:C40 family peptidase [Suttonella sp. R2A3]UJF24793.1 C40 family peptidase [Suttonella sp. R2A3]